MKKDNFRSYITRHGISLSEHRPDSSSQIRKLLLQHGCSLEDLYNRFDMYDPFAQFHLDQNTILDPVCLHSHNYYELIYCLQASDTTYLIGPDRFPVEDGDLLCIAPGISHRPIFSSDASQPFKRIILNLRAEFVASIFQKYASYPSSALFSVPWLRPEHPISARLRSLFESGYRIPYFADSQFQKISLVLQILSCIEQAVQNTSPQQEFNRKKDLVDQLIEYIDQNYARKLTLQNVAEHFFVSPSTISHLCQEQLQESFYQFVLQRRLTESQTLILQGLPLEQVSTQVGFSDYQNFYRAFKKHYGLSPRDCRTMFLSAAHQ